MHLEAGEPAEESLLARILAALTARLLRRPWLSLGALLATVVAALAITALRLEYRSSRLDLLNPHSAYNQRWLAYLDEFGAGDDIVLVVEGAQSRQVAAAVQSIAARLGDRPDVYRSVYFENDFSSVKRKSLQLAADDEIRQLENFVSRFSGLAEGDWRPLQVGALLAPPTAAELGNVATGSAGAGSMAELQGQLTPLAEGLAAALRGEPYRSPWAAGGGRAVDEFPDGLLSADDGRIALLLVRLAGENRAAAPADSEAIDGLRDLIADIQPQHPHTRIGLTGMPVLENDEMRTSQADAAVANVLGLFAVAALFAAGFGGLKHPLLTVTMLLAAFAWSFAFVALTIGHLNILSMAFGAILIGLGIDFGIYYVASYLQFRATTALGSRAALVRAAASVGPGIVTGAVTTSLAFLTAALTPFTGVAELGIVAGGGILLCLAAVLLVLPPLILVADKGRTVRRPPSLLPFHLAHEPVLRRPLVVAAAGVLLTCLAALGASRLKYDHNLLNLQPDGLSSVQWEKRLVEASGRSVWFAVSMADNPREAQELKARFEQLPSVDRVEEAASLLLPAGESKRAAIAQLGEQLQNFPQRAPELPLPSIEELAQSLAAWEGVLSQTGGEDSPLRRALSDSLVSLSETPQADSLSRLADFQRALTWDLLARVEEARRICGAEPITPDDLPAGVAERFLGRNGRQLLRIYGRGDIWDMDSLRSFVQQVESVDRRVTGHPVQTYYASREMQRSYLHASIYSFLAVAIVLMIDLRSLRRTFLAFLPLLLGVVQMFGLLGWLGIPLNAANMICLPLIMGIGIDGGVHVVHDFLRQQGRYRMSRSTGAAVILSSATTIVGFGVMAFGRHQGLRSLGQVLTLGVTCTMLSSLFLLPAALSWFTRNRPDAAPDTESGVTPERSPDEHTAEDAGPDRTAGDVRMLQSPRRRGAA